MEFTVNHGAWTRTNIEMSWRSVGDIADDLVWRAFFSDGKPPARATRVRILYILVMRMDRTGDSFWIRTYLHFDIFWRHLLVPGETMVVFIGSSSRWRWPRWLRFSPDHGDSNDPRDCGGTRSAWGAGAGWEGNGFLPGKVAGNGWGMAGEKLQQRELDRALVFSHSFWVGHNKNRDVAPQKRSTRWSLGDLPDLEVSTTPRLFGGRGWRNCPLRKEMQTIPAGSHGWCQPDFP